MNCPHCQSRNTRELCHQTDLDYRQFYCRSCAKQYNERTGTALNYIAQRTEVVMYAVHCYLRYKLSLDNVVEMMAMRGFSLCHQTVHNWVQEFGVYLSDVRDQAAAEEFFEQAIKTTGIIPTQITTDKEPALYPAIGNVFGENTKHRDSKYRNNRIEQDHRSIKSRYKVMKGFKNIFSALIFCTVFEEVRQFFSAKNKTRSERRSQFIPKFYEMQNLLVIAA